MEKLIPDKMEKRIEESGIIAVLVIKDSSKAVKLAQTLVNSGITAMELTLRTEKTLDSLKHIADAVPDMLAGAGPYSRRRRSWANALRNLWSPCSAPYCMIRVLPRANRCSAERCISSSGNRDGSGWPRSMSIQQFSK
jgi:hypothetical protein